MITKPQTGTRRIVIATAVLAVASAVFGVTMLASRPTSSAMSGMDMSGSSPAPADHGEMPGMDMSGHTPTPTMDPDMPGMETPGESHDEHGDPAGETQDRPLVPVLGTFGGGSAAVMLTAGFLRRKDRAASQAKRAARAAGRDQK